MPPPIAPRVGASLRRTKKRHRAAQMPFASPGQPARRKILTRRAIDALAQFLAGLEVWNEFIRNVHGGAGLRIAADTRRAVVQRKTTEAADLDTLPGGKRRGHLLEQFLHGKLDVSIVELRLRARDGNNEFRLSHFLTIYRKAGHRLQADRAFALSLQRHPGRRAFP